MINPQPVDEPRSPYRSDISSPAPPPRPIPAPPPSPDLIVKPKRRWGRWVALSFIVLILGIATFAYVEYRHLTDSVIAAHEGASSSVLKNHLTGGSQINAADYQKPGDGRINLVIVGIGGGDHPGTDLTDTIQVLSIDTINNKMTATSVPRDLYVTLPGGGRSKINAAYTYAEQKKKGSGMEVVREIVGNVLGINITNFALIDFSGIQEVVNDLGGIDVTVPKAISDPFFPCEDTLHYCPFYITAGAHHMDGATALSYSRSRETTSDFDRSARQQIVMQAIKAKALSVGFLANPLKVLNLANTLGTHFKTDLQTDDIRSLIDIYKGIPNDSNSTANFVLDTSAQLGLLSAKSDPVAGYIEYPTLGIDKFDMIHQWYLHNNPDPVLTKEKPTVTVFSSKSNAKQLQNMADLLTNYGYTVTINSGNYSTTSYSTITGITINSNKQVSANYLTSILGSNLKSDNPTTFSTDFAVYVPTSVTVNSLSQPTPTPSPTATP